MLLQQPGDRETAALVSLFVAVHSIGNTHLLLSVLRRLGGYFFYNAVFFSLSLHLLPLDLLLMFQLLCFPHLLGSLVGLSEFLLELSLNIKNRLRNDEMVTMCRKGFKEGFFGRRPSLEWLDAIVKCIGRGRNQDLCPYEVEVGGHEVSHSS